MPETIVLLRLGGHEVLGRVAPDVRLRRPGQWCHRAIVSDWFHRELGLRVPEVGFESETLHPLRPPEILIP